MPEPSHVLVAHPVGSAALLGAQFCKDWDKCDTNGSADKLERKFIL